jgi:hypothetical protein
MFFQHDLLAIAQGGSSVHHTDRVRRVKALVFVIFLLSVALPSVALAANDGDNGKSAEAHAKKDDSASTSVTTTASAPDESTTVALESDGIVDTSSTGNGKALGKSKKSSTTTTSAATSSPASTTTTSGTKSNGNGNGNGNGNNKSGGGGSGKPFDPDPPPTQTPPATTGPTGCDAYGNSQGGAYDHDNCDGNQGLNGNGGNGKCAGCTGKADDKGPGGQSPGDHNNGYECDHNSGVGKGNPAHSKCPKTPPPPCQTNCGGGCQGNCGGCQNNCNPGCQVDCVPPCQTNCSPGCVPSAANNNCEEEEDDVLGKVIHRAVPDEVLGERVRNDAVLPFTGSSSVVPMLTLGGVLIAVGSVSFLLAARKRRHQ